jgi:hypothetical protein
VRQVIDSWIPPAKSSDPDYYKLRNHNDYSSYRMHYIASAPVLRTEPVDERQLFGARLEDITRRMAMHDSYASPAQWIENNQAMLRVLNEEINGCRSTSYQKLMSGQSADRFMAEMIIESMEANDDPSMLLRNKGALQARYAEIFKEEMYKTVNELSNLSGKGPFGAFRITAR